MHEEADVMGAALLGDDDPGFDRLQFERAARRALTDLQRIMGLLAHRYLAVSRRTYPAGPRTMTWRALLDIEEQAFSDLSFQSRHVQAIVDGFPRLRDSRLLLADINDIVNWRRDDEQLPAVYVVVRALIEAETAQISTV